MSEFLAEARIVVRPDTSRFREQLEAQLKSVTQRPIPIPIIPVVGPGFAAAAAGTAALAAAQGQAAVATANSASALAAATTISKQYGTVTDLSALATKNLAVSELELARATNAEAAAQANATRVRGNAISGMIAQTAAAVGLRAGTLAASRGFIVGTIGILAFTKALSSAAAFETELNVFRVTAGATAEEMDRVASAARALGRDITLPGVTANQAAESLTLLSKAGLSVQESTSAVRGSLQLATAAQISNADSVKLVTNAMGQFNLAGTDASKVADLLSGAADASQGDILEMGTALGQAGLVANQFGVSIEDTVGLLTQLAQAGLQGGRAGTALRVAFLRLVDPPAGAAKALKQLNLESKIFDREGKLRPQIFGDIQKALEGYTAEQANAIRATIFGTDAIKVLGAISKTGAADLQLIVDEITELGLAQDKAAARTAGFEGDVENLKNQFADLGLTVGNVVKVPMAALVSSLADTVSTVNDLAIGIGGLFGKLKGLNPVIESLVDRSNKLGVSFTDIAVASVKFGPVVAPFTLLARGLDAVTESSEEAEAKLESIRESANRARDSFDALANGVVRAAKKISISVEGIVRNATTQLSKLAAAADVATVAGQVSDRQRAANLRARAAQEGRIADARDREAKSIGEGNEGIATAKKKRDEARARQADFLEQARSAEASAASAAKAAAEEITASRNKADEAFLEALGLKRSEQERKISAEARKAGLAGDIREQKDLLRLVGEQIAAVYKRISVANGQKKAIDALRNIQEQVKMALDRLKAEQIAAQKERQANLLKSIGLDISFAQITDDENAEISARERLIAQLRKQIAKVDEGTIKYKELRNAIAEETEAIEEIRKAKKEQNNASGLASFEFLQAQQGFASNLLGNLIPSGATGGLVGGSSVPSALAPVAGFSDSQSKSGPTSGQAQTTNAVLLRILDQLKILNGDNVAPEATRQNSKQRATMDFF